MDEFLQLQNFKVCEAMWTRYMMDHHRVAVPDAQTDSRPRKLLFQIMQDVRKSYALDATVDLRTLNNVALNLARDVFLRKGATHPQTAPPQSPASFPSPTHPQREPGSLPQPSQAQSIDRDSLLYGGRQAMGSTPRPAPTSQSKETFALENAMSDRFIHPAPSGDATPKWDTEGSPQVTDGPLPDNEMARRMAGRDDDALLAAILRQAPVPVSTSASPTLSNATSTMEDGGGSSQHLPNEVAASNDLRQAFEGVETFWEAPAALKNSIPIPTPLNTSSPGVSRGLESQQLGSLPSFQALGDLPRSSPSTAQSSSLLSTQVVEGNQPMGFRTLQQNAPATTVVERYIVVNGFDRYWQQSPLRYQYSVKVGEISGADPLGKSLQKRYRNIQSMQVTRLIIPMEILPRTAGSDRQSLLGAVSQKGAYQHAASLSFPYVMLSIDGYNDVYDGTNDAARRSFCQLVYSKSYRAPNGRGFVILEPMQDEKKFFYPSPLASLSRLTFSIQRPSGALFNDSTDDQTIMQVMYEVFNRRYIRIVLDRYFDMNAFYVGDSVVIQDYVSVQAIPLPGSPWRQDPRASFTALNTFLNRTAGHEIVELGLANDSGFFKSFCIMAPGSLDAVAGTFVLDAPVIAAVTEMNQPTTPCPTQPFGGALMNMSLQNVVSLKLGMLTGVGDAAFAV